MRWQDTSQRWSLVFAGARSLACVLSVGLALGCSQTHFDGRTYRVGDMAFVVGDAPPGWRAIEVSDALLAFRDDAAHATVAVHGRCGKDGDDVPLESLTQHLFIHFTEREIVDQRRLPMDGREAMRSEMVAKLDGVSRGFVVYVLKKDGCVYDFLYIGEPTAMKSSAESFDRYVATFRTTQ